MCIRDRSRTAPACPPPPRWSARWPWRWTRWPAEQRRGLVQPASLLCRPGHALVLDFHDGTTRQIPFDLSASGLALLVIDTRAPHQHAGGQYAARRARTWRAAELLGVQSLREVTALDAALGRLAELLPADEVDVVRRRVHYVVTENTRVE